LIKNKKSIRTCLIECSYHTTFRNEVKMDSLHSTMNHHIKGKHLSFEKRVIIQLRLKDGYSLRAIARELNCSPSTISYEVKRGTVELYHGKVKRYKATQGHDAYQAHRKNCGRKSDCLRKTQFMRYVHKHFFKDGWSLDVCSNRATAVGAFSSRDVVCTKTLYNYVDQGLLDIHNYDLPEKLKRNTKLHRIRKNKKKLGRSIEERPKEINRRNEFGHWECDLVLGHKSKDDEVLLTLSERMSREFLILRIPDKTSVSVMQAFKELQRQYSEHWNDIFKTITTDNGSEFADLSNLEKASNTLVYYAHPYTSCDKGTVERHNGLIRKFIPKREAIANYSLQDIINIETWCNSLPRKILAYHTPDEIFERELDLIYQVA
jgi:transposase, IS30 family